MVPTLQTVFPGYLCPNAPADMISAIGSGGQFLNVVPSQNLVWLRMGDDPTTSNVPFQLNDAIWEYVNELTCSSGIEEEEWNEEIQLYPNPVNEQLTLTSKGVSIGKIEVYDRLGAKLLESNSDQDSVNIDVSSFKEGIYFLSLAEKGRTMMFVRINH